MMTSDIKDLFLRATQLVNDLERKANVELEKSRRLDSHLFDLCEGTSTPLIWVTGPERARAKAVLFPEASAEDSVMPISFDTKYYTANALVNVNMARNVEDNNHAIILAMANEFNEKLAHAAFNSVGEVRICLCDDSRAADWCVNEGVEWIKWTDVDERLNEALVSTTWPGMTMKERHNLTVDNSASVKRTTKQELSAEEQAEAFEKIMARALQIREAAPNLSDEERKRRAAHAAEEMIKLLGLESDDE